MSKQPSAVLPGHLVAFGVGQTSLLVLCTLRSTLWALSHVWSNTDTSKTNSSLCWWSYLRVVLSWFFCWPGGSLPPEWEKLWMWRCWGRFLCARCLAMVLFSWLILSRSGPHNQASFSLSMPCLLPECVCVLVRVLKLNWHHPHCSI